VFEIVSSGLGRLLCYQGVSPSPFANRFIFGFLYLRRILDKCAKRSAVWTFSQFDGVGVFAVVAEVHRKAKI